MARTPCELSVLTNDAKRLPRLRGPCRDLPRSWLRMAKHEALRTVAASASASLALLVETTVNAIPAPSAAGPLLAGAVASERIKRVCAT